MKRRPTPELSPHLHFVTTRTSKRIPIFRNETPCQEFLTVLKELRLKDGFGLHAYVLMPDHIHLIVDPKEGDIRGLVRKFKSLGARRILAELKTNVILGSDNRAKNRSGF